ncbi:MAG: DNA replication/repair protein RecF [Dehalococcoidia bacterium]|nr:DNA replication/repair protein RecF [Dehalococcoidia bacterium]
MYIRLLSLSNFRNYADLEIGLPPGVCIFWGGNGQGKTNLLEAAYFLATTRSFRAEAEREVVRWDAWTDPIPAGRIMGQIATTRGPTTIEVVLHAARREAPPAPAEGQRPLVQKRVRVNGLTKRASDAVGELIAVLFSATEIHLVDGSPSDRRRYLDTAASQVDRRYRQVLARYSQVVAQRNSLLKAVQEGRARREELAFWDDEMVQQGAALMLMRRDLVAEVSPRAREVHAHLTEGREDLDAEYRPALPLPTVPSAASVAAAFRRALAEGVARDIAAGMSLVGPHRDDLSFLVEGVDMAMYGSRGQQRTIALSMKLAEAAFMEARRSDKPVLILDDVFSELDTPRRRQLMSAMGRFEQVLITCTDMDPFDDAFLERATVYWVQDGRVEAQRLPAEVRERSP